MIRKIIHNDKKNYKLCVGDKKGQNFNNAPNSNITNLKVLHISNARLKI